MLAPHDYEHDCINIVSRVVDHTPMNRYQRQQGLQNARYLWEIAYPAERFEVDLNQPTAFVMPNLSKIRNDIEKEADNQSKFFYQVSLPHFADDKFLKSVIQRYEHHLQLKTQHPHASVVPSIDVELISHAHLQHPLNYKQVTTEMFGAMLNPEKFEGLRSLGSLAHDSETGTRAVWSAAGFQFDKPGTMYRGAPPYFSAPRPAGFYANLGRLQYEVNILQVEVVNMDVTQIFYV